MWTSTEHLDTTPDFEVEQDGHPDGAIFGTLEPWTLTAKMTVLCIETSRTKSLQRGLAAVTGYDRAVHPHVWPNVRAVLP